MERITNDGNDWDHNVEDDIENPVVCVERKCYRH